MRIDPALMLLLLGVGPGPRGPAGADGAPGADGAAGPPGPDMGPGPRNIGTNDATDVVLRAGNIPFATLVAGGNFQLDANLTFNGDAVLNVGAPGARAGTVYASNVVTGDLDLRDDAKGVHWKLIEEREGVRLYNVVTGRSYMLLMEEVKP